MQVPNKQMLCSIPKPPSKLLHALLKSNSYHSNYNIEHSFLSLLKKCCTKNHIYQTHGFIIHHALNQDNFILSQFLHTCSTVGLVNYAYLIFNSNPKNIYLYNSMINIFSRQKHLTNYAIYLYKQARDIGLFHDTYSVPFVLNAVMCLSTGKQIHCEAILTGLNNNANVATSVVKMYSSFGCVSDARKVFDEMRERKMNNVLLWNAMIAGYVKDRDMDRAEWLFDVMPEKNVISWTTMISGYAQHGQFSQAIGVFWRMMNVRVGIKPDGVALLAALSACAHLGDLELGEWIHGYIVKHRIRRTVPLNNALIDMYAKSGDLKKAVELFESMESRSVVTWSTMIYALAVNGYGRKALKMFSQMEMVGIKPNSVTLVALLSACSHAGLVEECRFYFKTMEEQYGISPDIRHYGCMVDLLGRAGYLDEAADVIKTMPFEANAAIWGSLLAAARNHGHVELGEQALQRLNEVEPHNSGNYSLLSNTYASFGRWSEAREARKIMRDTGVKKLPGGSFIEVKNRVSCFYSGDRSHSQCERINIILSQLNRVSKMIRHEDWE